jgi:hypothetical protein
MPGQNKCGLPERVASHMLELANTRKASSAKPSTAPLSSTPTRRERLSRGLERVLERDYDDYHDYDKGKEDPWQRKKA